MRARWVLGHPRPGSLNHRLADTGVRRLRECGWDVDYTDLVADGFDPVLVDEGLPDVRREQVRLRDSDLLVLQFPLWWYGMPAILKGWVDRVFEAGFAYDVPDPQTGRPRKYGDGGLAGKRALAIVTAGDRPGSLGPRGISGHIEDVLWPLLHGTFWYTGMDALRPFLVTRARDLTPADVRRVEGDLEARLAGIADEAPIRYLALDEAHYDHEIALLPHVSPGAVGIAAHRH